MDHVAPARRLTPAAYVAAALVVLLAVFGVRACAGRDDYRPAALQLAQLTAKTGSEVSALRTQIRDLDRLDLLRRLRGWARDAEAHAVRSADLDPDKAFRRANGFLVTTLGLRAEAMEKFDPAIRNAVSDRDLQVAESQLLNVMRDLLLADRAYERFRAVWPPRDARPPVSRWLADEEDATIEGVAAFVRELRQLPALEASYNLTVSSVTVSPKPAGQTDGIDELPFTRGLTIAVVVENTGNQPVPAAPIAAIVTSEIDPEPRTAEGRVGGLRPKEKRSVTLEGVEATPGALNLLRVSVGPIGGERNLLDNTVEYKFVMRRRG